MLFKYVPSVNYVDLGNIFRWTASNLNFRTAAQT